MEKYAKDLNAPRAMVFEVEVDDDQTYLVTCDRAWADSVGTWQFVRDGEGTIAAVTTRGYRRVRRVDEPGSSE